MKQMNTILSFRPGDYTVGNNRNSSISSVSSSETFQSLPYGYYIEPGKKCKFHKKFLNHYAGIIKRNSFTTRKRS